MFKADSQALAALDVNEIVREVATLLSAEIHGQHLSVTTELADTLPDVLGDRVQLQQVLVNLIMNAIDAMSSVNKTRLLEIRSTVQEPNEVLMSVRDSGIGIDPKTIDRIFNPFFTTKSRGMGIGLAICRSIVQAHNGRIWASSGPEGGSIFKIALPAAPEGI